MTNDTLHTTDNAPQINTAATADTAATDTMVRRVVKRKVIKHIRTFHNPNAWTKGLEPVTLPARADHDSGVMTALVAIMLLMLLCVQKSRRLLPALYKDMWRVRNPKKNFDERTSNESRIIALYFLQLVVYSGILLSTAADMFCGRPPLTDTAVTLLPILVACAAFYTFQYIGFWAVGYAFTTSAGRRMWLRGYNAIATFLGFALAIPAITVIFYPDAAQYALVAAAVCYIISRIVFISKGFRIFYHNFSSLLYFILYLCTLEITPIVILFKISMAYSL